MQKNSPKLGMWNLIVLCLLPTAQAQELPREWTSKDGRTITATLRDIDLKKSEVSVVREDGATFQIPISTLSFDDQSFVQENIAKYSWAEIPAADPADTKFQSALESLEIRDSLGVEAEKRKDKSGFRISRSAPIGYRERHHFSYSGEVPSRMAIDDRGNLLFVTFETDPTAIQMITSGGILTQVYSTPEDQNCEINTPVIKRKCQIAAIPGGDFFFRANLCEAIEKKFNKARRSELYYFTLRFVAGDLVFSPNFSKFELSSFTTLQTLEAFAGDRLISCGTQVTLYDIPSGSNQIAEESEPAPMEAFWKLQLQPLQVISKSRVIAHGENEECRMVFLLDFEHETFSPLGPVASTEEEKASQLNHLAVSPDGRYLVYYKVSEQAFKWLDIGR